jgi:hypothetical protein
MIKLKDILFEAAGQHRKDLYVGTARVKIKGGARPGRKGFHEISMYRDHKMPYYYYLAISTATGNRYIVDAKTNLQKEAGKWAQGFIKRKFNGTGKEKFA